MPVPTAASEECVSPNRLRNQRPAANTIPDATLPHSTRAPGPIQPLFTASTKKKRTPSNITTPPAQASAFGPSRAAKSISGGGAAGGGGGGGGGRCGPGVS